MSSDPGSYHSLPVAVLAERSGRSRPQDEAADRVPGTRASFTDRAARPTDFSNRWRLAVAYVAAGAFI